MVGRLKKFGLVIIAISVLLISLQQNRFTLPQLAFAQSESPIDQSGATGTETPFPTVTLTATATITPTATPTPGVVAEIEFPSHGSVIFGFATIRGTALINQYRKYDIHISASGNEQWQWLTTSYDIVRGGDLVTFDTATLPDGFYDIRLRAIQDGGGFNEAFCRRIEVRNQNPPTPTPLFNAEGTPLPSPLQSPLPTPTPTPDIRIRIPGAQGFYGPAEGSTIRGYTPIKATANNLGFRFFERYELFISSAGLEDWSQLISSEEQHWQDTIFVLNTSLYVDGHYDLRLRIVYEDSNYSEYHLRRLRIANRDSSGGYIWPNLLSKNGFHQPRNGQHVQGVVDIIGTAVASDFLRWELHWSTSGEEAWSFLVGGEEQAVNELLAWLDLRQLPTGSYDFRLRIVHQDTNYDEHFVRNIYLSTPAQQAP